MTSFLHRLFGRRVAAVVRIEPAMDAGVPVPAADHRQPAPVSGPADAHLMLDDGVEGGRRLTYDDAAVTFVAWMQDRGETGCMTRGRIRHLYSQHCAALGLSHLPENLFLAALGRIARKHEVRDTSVRTRRSRTTAYEIPARTPVPILKRRA